MTSPQCWRPFIDTASPPRRSTVQDVANRNNPFAWPIPGPAKDDCVRQVSWLAGRCLAHRLPGCPCGCPSGGWCAARRLQLRGQPGHYPVPFESSSEEPVAERINTGSFRGGKCSLSHSWNTIRLPANFNGGGGLKPAAEGLLCDGRNLLLTILRGETQRDRLASGFGHAPRTHARRPLNRLARELTRLNSPSHGIKVASVARYPVESDFSSSV
jgi:hypothetical protein